MGLLQNVATLANPSANIIRPTDIMMAGQNAQQQIQGGINSITGQMAEGRKLDAQQRADTAVMNLLKEAPTGTQDPTKFNQMLGMASAYGSQGMKDTAKNAIESAREGYRTALQQQQFEKTFGLENKRFEEDVRSHGANEAFRGMEITNLKEHNDALLQLKEKEMKIDEKFKAGTLSNSQAQTALMKANQEFSRKIQTAELEGKGYEKDKAGNFVFNPNNPKALVSYASTLFGNFDKEFGAANIAKTSTDYGNIQSGWNPFTTGGGSLWASTKGQASDVMSRASQIQQLLPSMVQDVASQKGATQRDIDNVFSSAKSFIQTGQGDTNNPLWKKYKLVK